jgi:hypothetical protein
VCCGENLDRRERKLQESEENCIMKSFTICTFTKYYYLDKTKEDEMGGACRMRQIENTYKILVRETEQKRPVGRGTHT